MGCTGALPRGQPRVLPPPCPPQPPLQPEPCAGRPLTRHVPPGPSRERRSEGRARRHGASGTYPGAFTSPGRWSPVAASGQGSRGNCPLDAERLWGPERYHAGCLPSCPVSGPWTLRPVRVMPRAGSWAVAGGGDEHGDQAWLCPLRSGHVTDLCPLIRTGSAGRARPTWPGRKAWEKGECFLAGVGAASAVVTLRLAGQAPPPSEGTSVSRAGWVLSHGSELPCPSLRPEHRNTINMFF